SRRSSEPRQHATRIPTAVDPFNESRITNHRRERVMNVLLWVAQVALALLYLAGGAYKTFSFDQLARQMPALSLSGWRALGVVEMLGGVLLIVPAATKWTPVLTPVAAGVLALETLVLAAIYAGYSLKVAPSNPMMWALVMGVTVTFVAY